MKKTLCGLFFSSFLFFVFTSTYAEDAESTYQVAHECYVNLKADASLQKLREPWEKCIGQFEQVTKKYGRSDRGIDATFSLGKLYEGLAENSKNKADWQHAINEYDSFARAYAKNNMADDAYYQVAKIYWERFKDKSNAKKNLLKIIKFYKEGDRAGEASQYLNMINLGSTVSVRDNLVIVIDPGHGGSDTGALGQNGIEEKKLTLEISKKLASAIKKQLGTATIFLTREKDATLSLDERVKFANSKKADLFISIHANASTSKKEHGVQTYYLNNATDQAAGRLAKQENKYSGKNASDDLEKIISTMIQNISTEESRELATTVHKNLIKNLSGKYSGIADQKVRSALFYVLVGVKCPSILVETSYISNPKELKRLRDDKYQTVIANAVAEGVLQHAKTHNSLALSQ